MPGAILNIPSGGGSSIIEEWDFKQSLTGVNGNVATLTGTNISQTANGVHISGVSSCITIPISLLYGRKYTLKIGAFDFKGGLNNNTGIIMFLNSSVGFLRRTTGYMSVYTNSGWVQSSVLISTAQDFNNYLSNSEIVIDFHSNKIDVYVNGNKIISDATLFTSASTLGNFLTIGDSRSGSSGGQFYDVYIESLKIEPSPYL